MKKKSLSIQERLERGWELSPKEKIQVFKEIKTEEQMVAYFKKYGLLSSKEEALLFSSDIPLKVLLMYLKKVKELWFAAELKMFAHPQAVKLVSFFIKNHYLGSEAQLKLFELPNADKLIKRYVKKYFLFDKAECKVFELENAAEILEICISRGRLGHGAQCLLAGRSDLDRLAKLYFKKYGFDDKAREKFANRLWAECANK